MTLTQRIKDAAFELGFSLVGVCPAVEPPGLGRFHAWLEAGYDGQMRYLADRREAYANPGSVLDGARSVVMLAMNYATAMPHPVSCGQGRVSRYAWGQRDYHDVIHDRLKELGKCVCDWEPRANVRGVVDTAPLLEREFAQLAGLGWIAKNTMLINRQVGSWFFLAALLTDVELDFDEPHVTDHCGTCRACLDACPTSAFPEPYVLDATRCISYLTIELRGPMPESLREGVGDWVFGCDVCQDVCPWNRRAATSMIPQIEARPDMNPLDLIELFTLDDAAFRARFRQTPLWRSKRRGMLRNAAIVLGNQQCTAALEVLRMALSDSDPVVRDACALAIERIEGTG